MIDTQIPQNLDLFEDNLAAIENENERKQTEETLLWLLQEVHDGLETLNGLIEPLSPDQNYHLNEEIRTLVVRIVEYITALKNIFTLEEPLKRTFERKGISDEEMERIQLAGGDIFYARQYYYQNVTGRNRPVTQEDFQSEITEKNVYLAQFFPGFGVVIGSNTFENRIQNTHTALFALGSKLYGPFSSCRSSFVKMIVQDEYFRELPVVGFMAPDVFTIDPVDFVNGEFFPIYSVSGGIQSEQLGWVRGLTITNPRKIIKVDKTVVKPRRIQMTNGQIKKFIEENIL